MSFPIGMVLVLLFLPLSPFVVFIVYVFTNFFAALCYVLAYLATVTFVYYTIRCCNLQFVTRGDTVGIEHAPFWLL